MQHKGKKKTYSTPTLRKLTRDQAIDVVKDRKHCSGEEAAEFLKSFRQQPPSEATDRKRKRSA